MKGTSRPICQGLKPQVQLEVMKAGVQTMNDASRIALNIYEDHLEQECTMDSDGNNLDLLQWKLRI